VQISLENRQTIKHATRENGKFGSCGSDTKFGSCGGSFCKYLAPAALSANACRQIFWLLWIRWQIFGSVGKYLAPSANWPSATAPLANIWLRWQIWPLRQLRRQIIGSVGKFGFCGSSVGKYLAPVAISAIIWLPRQIWLLRSSVSKYLASSANIWLRWQIFGSVGKFGFCGSSVGKYLAPAAPSAIIWLLRQVWLLGSSVRKYLARSANNWLRQQLCR
jgi:hypothetical protein